MVVVMIGIGERPGRVGRSLGLGFSRKRPFGFGR